MSQMVTMQDLDSLVDDGDDLDNVEIPEDDGDGDEDEAEALEAKIAEEHLKFKEAQQQYQEKVRAARPWSAPPLGSPRPEDLSQRKEEAAALAIEMPDGSPSNLDSVSERTEYVPPERPEVERAAAKGGAPLSHMVQQRPMSADTAR